MGIDNLANKGSYAFGIVLEAKVRALVSMVKKHQPDCTLEQLQETVNRLLKDEWEKEEKHAT